MQTFLVTGGAGFVGGTFVRKKIGDSGVRIVNLDCLTQTGHIESLAELDDSPNHIFTHGNIGNVNLVRRLLEQYECDAVVNFAAESHVDRSIGCPAAFIETNVVGTFNLLEAVMAYWESLEGARREQFRFLHVSTDEIYGSLGAVGKATEVSCWSPNSPFAASKAASDHLVRAYHRTYGLPTLTTYASNNYGPYEHPEKLVPLSILSALEGRSLQVYGTGRNVRDWLYVEDHCEAIGCVLEKGRPGETYNIPGNCELTNLEVVQAVCNAVDQLTGRPHGRPFHELIEFVSDRPGHDFRCAVDGEKIARDLGWQPKMPFREGIQQTVNWYMNNLKWIETAVTAKYRASRPHTRPVQKSLREGVTTPSETQTPYEDEDDGHEATIDGVVFRRLDMYPDERGWLAELYREDELDESHHPVMAYLSETQPGVARGPHEHREQTDFFVFAGPGDFRIVLWDARAESPTLGERIERIVGRSDPHTVIVPPGVVHAYENISAERGWVYNAPNRLYRGPGKQGPIDEIRHEDLPDSPYQLHEPAAT